MSCRGPGRGLLWAQQEPPQRGWGRGGGGGKAARVGVGWGQGPCSDPCRPACRPATLPLPLPRPPSDRGGRNKQPPTPPHPTPHVEPQPHDALLLGAPRCGVQGPRLPRAAESVRGGGHPTRRSITCRLMMRRECGLLASKHTHACVATRLSAPPPPTLPTPPPPRSPVVPSLASGPAILAFVIAMAGKVTTSNCGSGQSSR